MSGSSSPKNNNNNNNNNIHGLALSIISATESETFDLGGLSSSTITQVIEDAFSKPLALKEMIRITLVVGAGKQARQKYDPQAHKVVTQTLSSKFGYQEDRGASCVVECAGLYKVQHDTGKNLKTVVIFPRISIAAGTTTFADGDDDDDDEFVEEESSSSKIKMIAISSMPVFKNMVKSKCWSWSQKKALVQLIETDIATKIEEYDNMLMRGQPLNKQQQSFYDNCIEISTKLAFVKDEMHKQVDDGQITEMELNQLLQQVDTRIAELEKQQPSNNKKVATMLAKAKERQTKLQSIDDPIDLPKLKHHAELGKLWKQVAPLMHIQEGGSGGGNLLSVQETKQLGKKTELLSKIGELEEASKGWLEDDETFELRVVKCRREFQAKFDTTGGGGGGKKKNGGGGGGKGGGSSKTSTITTSTKVRGGGGGSPTKWITPQQTKGGALSAKKKKMKKGDIFGAMAVSGRYDDSSSSDDDDDEDEDDDDGVTRQQQKQKQQATNTTSSSSSSPAKAAKTTTTVAADRNDESATATATATATSSKKKKKKKKGKKKQSDDDEDAIFEELDKEINKRKKQEQEEAKEQAAAAAATDSSGLLSVLISIVKIMYSILSSILVWLIGFLFGTSGSSSSKAKKKKKD